MKISKTLLVLSVGFIKLLAYGETLTLNDYLDLVTENSNELKSVQSSIDAAKGKLAEIYGAYSCYFSAGVNCVDDCSARLYTPPAGRIKELLNVNYDATVNKQFKTGTQISFGVNGSYEKYDYQSVVVPGSETRYNNKVNDASSFIKLQQSLFKNINGGSTKANIAKARVKANTDLYSLEYKKQNILLNAKLAYWNLSYSRTVVDFRKASLNRTEKVLKWIQRRYNMDLAEKSDLLQLQAAMKSRELNLKLAYEDEGRANREFNRFLNVSDEEIRYSVTKFEENGNSFRGNKEELNKKGVRADVLSALENAQVAFYDQIVSKKNSGADLILSGQYSLNGVEESFDDSLKHITSSDRPYYSVGLRYTLPLDFKLRKTINQGYESAKISAEQFAQYLTVQENSDWLQLMENWRSAKIRFELAYEITKIQEKRCVENKNLLNKGRTTTYQVLQCEQDLDDSILSMLRSTLELIKIYEQAETLYK